MVDKLSGSLSGG
jgi:hypothetical protein